MKKKFLKNTYLLGVKDYDITIVKDEQINSYVAVKYIKDIDKPYITTHNGKNFCLLDDGYYVLEYVPFNSNYVVRAFLNDKKEVQQYYIDITKQNGYENNTPFYLDLYLDVTIDVRDDNKVIVWDEDELQTALDKNDITKEDYELAYNTLSNLLDEINNNSNNILNQNHKQVIENLMRK